MARGSEQFGNKNEASTQLNGLGRERDLDGIEDKGLMVPGDVVDRGVAPVDQIEARLKELKKGLEGEAREGEKKPDEPSDGGSGVKKGERGVPELRQIQPGLSAFKDVEREGGISVATIVREVMDGLGLEGEANALGSEVVAILSGNFSPNDERQNFSEKAIKLAASIVDLVTRAEANQAAIRDYVTEHFHA